MHSRWHRHIESGGRVLIVILCAALTARGAEEDEYYTWGEIYDQGVELVTEILPDEALEEYEIMSSADWQKFWDSVEGALSSDSLEELEWLLPSVEYAMDLLETVPGAEPYEDWIRQRADYFEVADAVLKAVRSTEVPAEPAPARRAERTLTPRPRPVRASAPRAIQAKRMEAVQSAGTWKKKLAGRRAPEQAADLVPRLKKAFREEGVPEELVWIAEVESSMNPKAKSPVGAVGLFQFMPATARSLGLKTALPDQRQNPELSARAAARYLKHLHGRCGSWPLAFAAYNAGEGRVGKLLRKTSGKDFASISDHLPVETQMYVPKVLATVELREGKRIEDLPPPRG